MALEIAEEEDTLSERYLTFSIAKESYGIEISSVIEIIGILPITPVPELPEYIKGVINLRGKVIPVLDVRARLKLDPAEYNERTCIIVVTIFDSSLGLIVDKVADVLKIQEEDISLPIDMKRNTFVKGIGQVNREVKLILDCEKLMSEQVFDGMIKL